MTIGNSFNNTLEPTNFKELTPDKSTSKKNFIEMLSEPFKGQTKKGLPETDILNKPTVLNSYDTNTDKNSDSTNEKNYIPKKKDITEELTGSYTTFEIKNRLNECVLMKTTETTETNETTKKKRIGIGQGIGIRQDRSEILKKSPNVEKLKESRMIREKKSEDITPPKKTKDNVEKNQKKFAEEKIKIREEKSKDILTPPKKTKNDVEQHRKKFEGNVYDSMQKMQKKIADLG